MDLFKFFNDTDNLSFNTFEPTEPDYQKREKLIKRLQINDLLKCSHEYVLEKSIKDIIKTLGHKQILLSLTASLNQNSLDLLHGFIKKRQIEWDNRNKTNEMNDEGQDEDNGQESASNGSVQISLLPPECHRHISSFLNRESIINLRYVSRQFAVVCLYEMNKISVGCSSASRLKSGAKSYFYRFHRNTKFHSFQTALEKMYNITVEKQLLFEDRKPVGRPITPKYPSGWGHLEEQTDDHTARFSLIDSDKMRDVIIQKRKSFLVVDRRKCVILTGASARRYDSAKDTFESLKDFDIMLLEYLDCWSTQKTKMVQFILYKPGNIWLKRLELYIRRHFIFLDCFDNDWYNELKKKNKSGQVKAIYFDGYETKGPYAVIQSNYLAFRIADVLRTELERRFDSNLPTSIADVAFTLPPNDENDNEEIRQYANNLFAQSFAEYCESTRPRYP